MCAQFNLKTQAQDLNLRYGIQVPESLQLIDERFYPSQRAPVIVYQKNLKLVGMNFSLIPSWSKEARVPFATHNARIETVTEKPTWKIPFEKNHCIVPLSGFFESVYEGPLAGNIIHFTHSQNDILFAAAIFDTWKNPANSQSINSFSILTTTPSPFILEHGHDRSPIFLNFEQATQWTQLVGHPQKQVQFLLDHHSLPPLKVDTDRPLKPGWERRK